MKNFANEETLRAENLKLFQASRAAAMVPQQPPSRNADGGCIATWSKKVPNEYGLFAERDFRKGEHVADYRGVLLRVERSGCRATESFGSLHIRIPFKFCRNSEKHYQNFSAILKF